MRGVGPQLEDASGFADGVAGGGRVFGFRHEDAGGFFGEESLKARFFEDFFPFAIVGEVGPVLEGGVAGGVLQDVDEAPSFFGGAIGGDPVADGIESVLLEDAICVFAEA